MANACYTDRVAAHHRLGYVQRRCSRTPVIRASPPAARCTDDVFKCQLKAIDAKDYKVAPTAAQTDALKAAFPNGVCDYTKPGVGQVPLAGTWLMFMGDARTVSIASAN